MKNNATRRMMHLGACIHESGQHVAAWRHPDARAESGTVLPDNLLAFWLHQTTASSITHYYFFRHWAHDCLFSDQDKMLIESTVPGPERLSRTDVGVIAWRKFAGASARRSRDD